MERFLGVKVERVARQYTTILPIGRETHGQCRLTTLSPEQDVAEIDLFLLKQLSPGAEMEEVRRLHHFTVRHTRKPDGTRPLLRLVAEKHGLRKYTVQLFRDSRLVESTVVKVPLRPNPGVVVAVLVALLLILAVVLFTCRPQAAPAGNASRAAEPPQAPSAPAATVPAAPTPTVPPQAAPVVSPQTAPPPVAAPEPITRNFTVYFYPDSSRFTEGSQPVLQELATLLLDNQNRIGAVIVEGHTALFGSEAGREQISSGRIQAVLTYAENAGWSPKEPPIRRVLGASAPVTRSQDDQHLNRRAEITVTYREDDL